MNLQTQVRNMAAAQMATKRVRCRRAGGPDDLAPMLDVRYADGRSFVVLIDDRDAIEGAVEMVRNAREDVPVAAIGMLADTYAREAEDQSLPPERIVEAYPPGLLAAQFRSGDLSVHEELTVTVIDVKSGDVCSARVPYTYGDDGQPRFGKLDTSATTHHGQVVDNLRAAAAACRE